MVWGMLIAQGELAFELCCMAFSSKRRYANRASDVFCPAQQRLDRYPIPTATIPHVTLGFIITF